MAQKILLVQLADIGDMILTTPALAALRESLPGAHLTLLTSPHAAQVVDASLVDHIIRFDKRLFTPRGLLNPLNGVKIRALVRELRAASYDAMVFFHHFTLPLGTLKFRLIASTAPEGARLIGLDNGQAPFLTESLPDEGFGARHQVEYWLALVGLLGASSRLRSARVPTSDDVLPLPPYGRQAGTRGVRVVLHAGSGGYSTVRRWFPARFAQVADALIDEHAAQILIVGTPDDDGHAVMDAMQGEAVNLIGRTSLPQLADLIRTADLFIGAESGVLHLAAAVGAPVVAIYGPGNDRAWGPWSPQGRVALVRTHPECGPCSYVEHRLGAIHGCAARTCLRMVTVDEVLKASRALLNDQPYRTPDPPLRRPAYGDRLRVLQMPVDRITYAQWMQLIDQWVRRAVHPVHVCTVNPEFIMIAHRDPVFYNILQRATLCVPDGVGLLWAARLQGQPIPERVTGSDGVPIIAQYAARQNWRLFFLGAAEGVADQAANILTERYPGLQVVGRYSGSPSPDDEAHIVQMVNLSGADILLVAYGAPEQDKWIARNLPRLQVKMAMGVGGSFDFVAGVVPRAPEWMRKAGLEWLYRLYLQPWRLRRMQRLPRFVVAVLWRYALERLRRWREARA